VAIRRLRRLRHRELGTAPAVIYLAGCYGVFSPEEYSDCLALLLGKASCLLGGRPHPPVLPLED
jgi:hypothetical protein